MLASADFGSSERATSLSDTPRSRSSALRASPCVRGRDSALSSGVPGAIVAGNVCPDLDDEYVMSTSHSQPKSDSGITGEDAARIGGRIRHIRGGANQKEFASRLGISREQLSRIESGVQVPGTETLRRLARVTNVPIDFILLGSLPAGARSAVEAPGSWEAALDPLLAGTMLSLPRAAVSSGRKVDRAWQQLSEERREEIRNFVRRIALVAVAIEQLLPEKSARAVHDQLSTEVSTVVIDRILEAS